MKKVHYFNIIVGITLLSLLASCGKEEMLGGGSLEKESEPGLRYERIIATLGDVHTKVFFDDAGDFSWSSGDLISVYTSKGVSKIVSVSEEGASVAIEVPIEENEYRDKYAVYPSASYYSISNDILYIRYPSSYVYSPNKAPTPMVALNSASSSSLEFKHVGGLVKIEVSNIPEGTSELQVVFPGEVTGIYSVTMDSNGNPTLEKDRENQRIVTFTGVYGPSAVLYIPVPTGIMSGRIGIISNATGTFIPEASVEISKDFKRTDGKRLSVSSFEATHSYGFLELTYGTANCFIVLPGESSKEISILPWSVGPTYLRLSQQSGVSILQEPAYSSIYWQESSLSFETNIVNDKLVLSNIRGLGNAVVAIYSPAGEILWSYHIWVPGFDPNNDFVEITRNGNTYQVMRAAIGATAPGISGNNPDELSFEQAGLYYQWGRKDPLGRAGGVSSLRDMDGTCPSLSRYVTSKEASESFSYDEVGGFDNYDYGVIENRRVLKYSIQHPSTIILRDNDYQGYDWICGLTMGNKDGNLWRSSEKTIFDPSPEGWQVPNTQAIYGNRTVTVSSADDWMYYQYNSSVCLAAFFVNEDPFDAYLSMGSLNNHVGYGPSRLDVNYTSSSAYWSTGDGDDYGKAFLISGGTNIYTYWPDTGSDVAKEDGNMIRCAKLVSSSDE